MTTTIASGLGATLGWATETTVGTYVPPTVWLPFTKEALKYAKGITQSKALSGGLYMLTTGRADTTHTAAGAISLDLHDRCLGKLFRMALGAASTPTENASSGVYTTVFTPADTVGQALSFQVGRPMTDGVVQSFSYNGGKIVDWTLNVATGQIATFDVTLDTWNESISQSYTAPSYVAANTLQFAEAALILGGTPTTTDGVCSIAGGTSLPVGKSCQIKSTNPLETDRFFLGSSGTKAEQITSDFRTITGQVELEFENVTDVYNAFIADTSVALQLTFTGPVIADALTSSVEVLIPHIFWDGETPTVDGPGVLSQTAPFTGLADQSGNPAIQITTVSLDATV